MSEETGLSVDVVSDVVCPWCFIGMKRLDRALALAPEVAVKVLWRPYQLDPTIPPEGMARRDYMLNKFGSEERLREIHANVARVGEAEGIRFNFDAIERSPNTLDAHRLIRWAASPKAPAGMQPGMVKLLFEFYFEQGRDIGDRAVLVEAAGECGMDGSLVEALLASDADAEAVRGEVATAARMGVQGVPCFLLEGKYAVTGAQEAEVLADAFRQVSAAKARGELDAFRT